MGAFRVSALRRVLSLALGLAGGSGCSPEAPRLDAIRPLSGDAAGGTTVRLEGAGFVDHGPLVVYFGLRSARAVVIVDDRLITVVTPEAEALGPSDVKVVFADGTELGLPRGYDYTSADGTLKPIPFMPGRPPPDEAAEG
ncbi:IPT/TIG domain-containing protein [Nannocystis sp.]|uniref:IPT/TIG domain-containing protein n=1 Tax=Nannocystis sp. TaxID=1962667 RepID=UPI0024280665|nr:IPT/TIG domain-containing protein [Nannocystis sp.]MBK7824008.1 IPT/TIG domain-containing protein [Nannocystis sp.]MBK9755023.1 IPT/TIG domain-containing protein [Nannocystis sp.]